MLLEPHELPEYFLLRHSLLYFVNERRNVLPNAMGSILDFGRLPTEDQHKIREALSANLDLIDAFVAHNPARLATEQLEIVRAWRSQVAGKFYIVRGLKKYTVFLSSQKPSVAYGVLALSQPFARMVGPFLPILVEAVLLPFRGRIVHDGLMRKFDMTLGGGVKRLLDTSYKAAKTRHGIVTSLPMSTVPRLPDVPLAPQMPEPRPVSSSPTKKYVTDALPALLELIEPFCRKHLNEEYAVLCRKMAEKLARMRPSPLGGNLNAWASGIIRAVGGVNFLHDKSQKPYLRATDIDYFLGISPSSGATKVAAIRKMLKVYQCDPNWTLPSRLATNPLVWMIQLNGSTIDVRRASRDVQELAFNKGLIPYIPADGKPSG